MLCVTTMPGVSSSATFAETPTTGRPLYCESGAVLSTPWGNQSEWGQHPLLVALHREAWGGEKFFDMLDRTSKDPAKFIDLMELQYLALAFGFASLRTP